MLPQSHSTRLGYSRTFKRAFRWLLKTPQSPNKEHTPEKSGNHDIYMTSPDQLSDFGIPWVILGHSERRSYYGDSNEIVGRKVQLAIDNKVKVIACIGENLEQREKGSTIAVIQEQLNALKGTLTPNHWPNVVLAYEPVWAIGTGKTASPEQA